MATEVFQDVSVTDVYDQAAGVAREFDKLINNYGNEAVTELMPKVIRALEQLESLASRFEKDNEEIAQLRSSVEKLESEKAGKAQERAKFEQVRKRVFFGDKTFLQLQVLFLVYNRKEKKTAFALKIN